MKYEYAKLKPVFTKKDRRKPTLPPPSIPLEPVNNEVYINKIILNEIVET